MPRGTVARAKATCPCCGTTLAPDRVRAQLRERRGGADVVFDKGGHRSGGATMLAVVTLRTGVQGREYRLPVTRDYSAVRDALKALEGVCSTSRSGALAPVPNESLPPQGTLGFRVQLYGMTTWGICSLQDKSLRCLSSVSRYKLPPRQEQYETSSDWLIADGPISLMRYASGKVRRRKPGTSSRGRPFQCYGTFLKTVSHRTKREIFG